MSVQQVQNPLRNHYSVASAAALLCLVLVLHSRQEVFSVVIKYPVEVAACSPGHLQLAHFSVLLLPVEACLVARIRAHLSFQFPPKLKKSPKKRMMTMVMRRRREKSHRQSMQAIRPRSSLRVPPPRPTSQAPTQNCSRSM